MGRGRGRTAQIVGNPSTEVKRISILAIFHTNGAALGRKSLAMIGLSWLADLPAREREGERQPDDILQPFNTVACVTLPRTMPQTQTQTARRRQTGCLSSSLSPESVASKQKTISRKLTEILQCCFIIISRWGQRTEQSRAEACATVALLLWFLSDVCLATWG